jgi:hypothetical protein
MDMRKEVSKNTRKGFNEMRVKERRSIKEEGFIQLGKRVKNNVRKKNCRDSEEIREGWRYGKNGKKGRSGTEK